MTEHRNYSSVRLHGRFKHFYNHTPVVLYTHPPFISLICVLAYWPKSTRLDSVQIIDRCMCSCFKHLNMDGPKYENT